MNGNSQNQLFSFLPVEIYLCILQWLHFEDWVALTRVNRRLREVLDTPMFLEYVYKNSFGEFMMAYNVFPGRLTKETAHKTYVLMSLLKAKNPSIDLSSSSVQTLLTEPDAYCPVADLMEQNEKELLAGIKRFSELNVLDLSTYACLRKVFQLQNYHIANQYFEVAGEDLSEESFFQLSRYSSDFFELARHRSQIHAQINAALDRLQGIQRKKGTLKFQDNQAYEVFLKTFCRTVLSYLPSGTGRDEHRWTTITAFYAGKHCGDDQKGLRLLFILYILAKFLKERLLSLTVVVGETIMKTVPRVKSKMLLLDEYAILVDFEGRIKLMDSRLLRRWGILRHQENSNNIFDFDYLNNDIRLSLIHPGSSWKSTVPSTLPFEHVKCLSTDHCIDTKSYGNTIKPNPMPPSTALFSPMLFTKGDLVMSSFHGIIGTIMKDVSRDNLLIEVGGINSGIADVFRIGDFKKISPADVSSDESTLQDFVFWLTRNARLIHLVGSCYTHLTIDDGHFRLI